MKLLILLLILCIVKCYHVYGQESDNDLLSVGLEDNLVQSTPFPTKKPSMSPTKNPTAPTYAPIPKSEDPSLIVAVDETFMDYYVDPFKGSDFAKIEKPNPVVVEHNRTTKSWTDKSVKIPFHLDYVKFNLWHGQNNQNIRPYKDEDFKIRVTSRGEILKSIKLTTFQSGEITNGFEAEILCNSKKMKDKEEEAHVTFILERFGYTSHTFKLSKECEKIHNEEFLISSQNGDILYNEGKVNPSYNLHDIRTRPFIASKGDQSDSFYFHTLSKQYKITGRPQVKAYQPNSKMLKWILMRSPNLKKAYNKYQKKIVKEKVFDTILGENNDMDDIYGENIDKKEYSKDDDEENIPEVQIPTKINLNRESKVVSSISNVCDPTTGGELGQKKNAIIRHRKDIGEASLLGFAQAGLLGMHGARQLAIRYNCMQDGLAFIVVTANILGYNYGNDVQREEHIRFSYLKVCSARQISNSTIDLMGFNVRLGLYSRDDPSFFPIVNGIPTGDFTWDRTNIRVSAEESHTSFYIKLRNAVQDLRNELGIEEVLRIRRVRIPNRYNYLDIMKPKLSGHGAHGGLVSSEALPITVHYHCQKSGEVKTGIDILIDVVNPNMLDSNGDYLQVGNDGKNNVRRISFYWVKECYVAPMNILGMSTVDSKIFTDDHTKDKEKIDHEKVISRGVVEPKFSKMLNTNEEIGKKMNDNIKVLSIHENIFAAKLFEYQDNDKLNSNNKKHNSPHMGISFRVPILHSSNPNVRVSLRNIGEMERLANLGKKQFLLHEGKNGLTKKQIMRMEKRERKKGFKTDAKPVNYHVSKKNKVYIVVDHICAGSGTSDITLQLPVYANRFEIMNISWKKECTWTKSHLSVSQASKTILFFVILAIIVTSALFFARIKNQYYEIKLLEEDSTLNFNEDELVLKDSERFDKVNPI